VYIIPGYSFGVEVKNKNICLSNEHEEIALINYEKCRKNASV
jgi:hypothetical protein